MQLKIIFVIAMLALLATASGQTKQPPPDITPTPSEDYSCLKYEAASLREAATDTDLATAQLHTINADAYERLNQLHLSCQQ